MGKFYFFYGTMGAGKTSCAINKAYEFIERGKKVYVCLPSVVWNQKIKSRNGLEIKVSDEILGDEYLSFIPKDSIVILDEAQFLSENGIYDLKDLSTYNNVMVLCFGLLTDYKRKLFRGSEILLEVADSLREIPCMCEICEKKAQYNYRCTKENGIMVLEKNKYKALCNKCFNKLSKAEGVS